MLLKLKWNCVSLFYHVLYLLLQKKYLVYSYDDAQVVLLEETDVLLGQYSDLSVDEWKKFGEEEVKVRAVYGDEVYAACLLMVVTEDDDDCREVLHKLRDVIARKHFKSKRLIQFCGTRVKTSHRLRVPPTNVSISFCG